MSFFERCDAMGPPLTPEHVDRASPQEELLEAAHTAS